MAEGTVTVVRVSHIDAYDPIRDRQHWRIDFSFGKHGVGMAFTSATTADDLAVLLRQLAVEVDQVPRSA